MLIMILILDIVCTTSPRLRAEMVYLDDDNNVIVCTTSPRLRAEMVYSCDVIT